jgi:hypothetical protein
MRNMGGMLLLVGALGFFYCTARLSELDPVPAGRSISESLQYTAGRFEVARYGALLAGGLGLILALFPKGR